MPDPNDTRRLAPDTKWILTAAGTGFALVIGINQYQLDSIANHFEKRLNRTAELTLSSATANQLTREELNEAFRPRDKKLANLEERVGDLREERAKVGQTLDNIDKTMSRIVDVSIQTQARAAQTEGQLTQLLSQTETNASLAAQLVERQQSTYNTMSERLTRLESSLRPVTPAGVP